MQKSVNRDSTRFYSLLEVHKSASETDIRKSYLKLSRFWHPDRNASEEAPEKSAAINLAYEVLSDKKKKDLYDKYGEDVALGKAPAPNSMHNLFHGDDGERSGEDIVVELGVTLKDLYCGCVKTLSLNKTGTCPACNGQGCCENASSSSCSQCGGYGVVLGRARMGPFIQTVRMKCDMCDGKGVIIADEDLCDLCHGSKTVPIHKEIEVGIDKGMEPEVDVIRLGQEGNEAPGLPPGDLVVQLADIDSNSHFKRQHQHLIYTKKITLLEAINGIKFTITHLDGRQLLINNPADNMIVPGELKVIQGEGMPIYGDPFQKGDLIISFEIQFPVPGSISPEQRELLEKALTRSPVEEANPEAEEKQLVTFSKERFKLQEKEEKLRRQRQRQAYDEDDQDGNVQSCVHM